MSAAGDRRPVLAYVVHTLNAGGTEKLVVEMSLAFRADYEVRVVCLDEPGQWAGELRAAGVPVHCAWRQPGFDAALPARLAALFRRWRVDLVHAHQCTPWLYAALARAFHRRPRLLLEEHGRFHPEVDSRPRRWLNGQVARRLTHHFVAVSQDIRARLVRYEGLREADIDVVYNGVHAEPAPGAAERGALRAALGFGPEDFVVGTVGRFDPIKNLPLLVDALQRAQAQAPQVRGLLVGHGPEYAAVQARLAAAGLQDRVVLTGFRQDARRLVHAMDLFVLASYSEGTSMALLEAIGAGVPVAVTRVGGNPEIVAAGETGWVVPSDDREALTAALLDAVHNDLRRAQYAGAGLRRFQERYTFDAMLRHYARTYRELLGS